MTNNDERMALIRIPAIDDFHLHLRDGDLMDTVIQQFPMSGVRRGFVMPNLVPPITSHKMAYDYQQRLVETFKKHHSNSDKCNKFGTSSSNTLLNVPDFRMLLFLDKSIKDDAFSSCEDYLKNSVQGIKSYPKGVTTNSDGGVESYEPFYPLFKDLERNNKSLHIHGEVPGIDPMKAETKFLPELDRLARAFPQLKIVLEHVSTKEAVECVKRLGPNVAGTITPQHACLSRTDVFTSTYLSNTEAPYTAITSADIKEPHYFCKPFLKSTEDKETIQQVIFNEGHKRFFFGSDSAPHWVKGGKDRNPPSAGCYSSPIAAKVFILLAKEIGDKHVGRDLSIERCKRFLCENGARFFGLKLNEEIDDTTYEFYLSEGSEEERENSNNFCENLIVPVIHPLQGRVTMQQKQQQHRRSELL